MKRQLLKTSGGASAAELPGPMPSSKAEPVTSSTAAATPSAATSNETATISKTKARRERRKKGKVFLEDKSALLSLMDNVTDKKNAIISEKLAVEKQRVKADKAKETTKTKKNINKKQEDKRKALVGCRCSRDVHRVLTCAGCRQSCHHRSGSGEETAKEGKDHSGGGTGGQKEDSRFRLILHLALSILSHNTLKHYCMHHFPRQRSNDTRRTSKPRHRVATARPMSLAGNSATFCHRLIKHESIHPPHRMSSMG